MPTLYDEITVEVAVSGSNNTNKITANIFTSPVSYCVMMLPK